MVSVPRLWAQETVNAGPGECVSKSDIALLSNALAGPTPQPHPDPIAWMVGTAFWWTKEEAERDAAETGLPVVGLGPMAGAVLADQHQGEPVTLPARKDPTQGWAVPGGVAKADGWNACLDEIAKLGPLYTRAEIERLRKACEAEFRSVETLNEDNQKLRANAGQHKLEMDAACGELEILRAQLAEAHAHPLRALGQEAYSTLAGMIEHCLNQRVCMGMDEGFKSFDPEEEHDFVKKLREFVALSASAEPSVPKCETCYDAGHVPEPMSCKGSLPCPSCAPVEIDHDALVAAVCVLRSHGLDNLSAAVEEARAALERKPS